MVTDTNRACRFYERGVYYYEMGKWTEAAVSLRDALRLYPDHFSARMHLGATLARQRLFLDAVRILEEGRQNPSLDDESRLKLLRLMAVVCVQRQDYPAAEYYLSEALEARPDDFLLLNQLASTMCKAGHFNRGFDLFLRATRQSLDGSE